MFQFEVNGHLIERLLSPQNEIICMRGGRHSDRRIDALAFYDSHDCASTNIEVHIRYFLFI